MAYDKIDYYEEALASAFDEHGVVATDEQLKAVARDISLSIENEGMAFYRPPPSEHPSVTEAARLKKELADEREKVGCPHCGGRGSITIPGPYHSSTSQCDTCRGDGKVHPSAVRWRA